MDPLAGEEPEPISLNRRRVLHGAVTLAWTTPMVTITRPALALAGSPIDDEPDDDLGPGDRADPGEPDDEPGEPVDLGDESGKPVYPGDDRQPDPGNDRQPIEPQEVRSQPDRRVDPVAGEKPPPAEGAVVREPATPRVEVPRLLADTGLHAGWLSATGAAALVLGGAAVAEAERQERRSAAQSKAAEHPAEPPATMGLPAPPDRTDEPDG